MKLFIIALATAATFASTSAFAAEETHDFKCTTEAKVAALSSVTMADGQLVTVQASSIIKYLEAEPEKIEEKVANSLRIMSCLNDLGEAATTEVQNELKKEYPDPYKAEVILNKARIYIDSVLVIGQTLETLLKAAQ